MREERGVVSEKEREREEGAETGGREGEKWLPVSRACKVSCTHKCSQPRVPLQGHPSGVHILELVCFLGIQSTVASCGRVSPSIAIV